MAYPTNGTIEGKMLEVLRAPDHVIQPLPEALDIAELYRASLVDAYMLARQAWVIASPMAVSHRDCHVVAGARLIQARFSNNNQIDVFGYNVKVTPGNTPNVHAEEIILHQSKHLGGVILNLVVVGEPQTDNSISGNDLVLAPCDYRCTPKIITDDSVGSFSMTTCVNPMTGATQFIPHSSLHNRDWSAIPCIEVAGLNDFEEWFDKAGPIIDMLMQNVDFQAIESMIEDKIQKLVEQMARLFMTPRDGSLSEPSFVAPPQASVLSYNDGVDQTEIFRPLPEPKFQLVIGSAVPEFINAVF